jgi:hypothetical protein
MGVENKAVEMKLKGMTYAEIGKALGVSRQRAQQMVRPPKAIYDAVQDRAKGRCEHCGIELQRGHVHHKEGDDVGYNDLRNLEYLCISCHRAVHSGPVQAASQDCKCRLCGHAWVSGPTEPLKCPKCKRYTWHQRHADAEVIRGLKEFNRG